MAAWSCLVFHKLWITIYVKKFLLQDFEDVLLLVGTTVAFLAFILWCFFPAPLKDGPTLQHKKKKNRNDGNYNQVILQYDLLTTWGASILDLHFLSLCSCVFCFFLISCINVTKNSYREKICVWIPKYILFTTIYCIR